MRDPRCPAARRRGRRRPDPRAGRPLLHARPLEPGRARHQGRATTRRRRRARRSARSSAGRACTSRRSTTARNRSRSTCGARDDRAVFERLLDVADVLVENFRPGVLERLGYGWDVLQARWPRLVYAAASGFGHTGPLRERPAFDMVAQAMGGIMSLTGYPDAPAGTRRRVDRRHRRRALPRRRRLGAPSATRRVRSRHDGRRRDARLPARHPRERAHDPPGDRRGAATGSARVTRTSHRSRPSRPATAGRSSSAPGTTRSSPRCARAIDRPDLAQRRTLPHRRCPTPARRRARSEILAPLLRTRPAAEWLDRFEARRHSVRPGEHGRRRRAHARRSPRVTWSSTSPTPRSGGSRSRATRSRSTAYPIRSRAGRRPTSTPIARTILAWLDRS